MKIYENQNLIVDFVVTYLHRTNKNISDELYQYMLSSFSIEEKKKVPTSYHFYSMLNFLNICE